MNREEFLKQLQEALVGRVPDQVVQENIIYYRRYISEQISGGKSEPEVLRMLGDPRLLAKTIEGTSKFASNMGKTQKDYSGYTNSSFNGNFNSSYNNSDYGYEQGRNTKQFRMPLWAVLCIVLVVFVLILTLAFRVFVFLAPFILMVMVATFVVRIVRNWIGKF